MADLNKLSQKNDSVNGSELDVSDKNIQNDIHSNIDPKLAESENFPDKENPSIKPEENAESEELVKSDNVNIQNDIHSNTDLKLAERENFPDKESKSIKHEENAEFEELVRSDNVNIHNDIHSNTDQKLAERENFPDKEKTSIKHVENAESEELVKSDNVNIQNDIHSNTDQKLAESENFPDKEKTSIKHEENAESEELVKSDNVNGVGFRVSVGNNIQNDLHCGVYIKLTETENIINSDLVKENDNLNGDELNLLTNSDIQNDLHCAADEKVAETENIIINDSVYKMDSVNGEELHLSTKNHIKKDLHCDVDQTFSESENVTDKDIKILKEKYKLLKVTNDLQKVFINLLRQQFKLLDIKYRKINNDLMRAVEVVQKAVDEALRSFLKSSNALRISELENILKIVARTNAEFQTDPLDNIEQISEEMHSLFLKFQEIYKSCTSYLENFLQKPEKTLNINTVPNNWQRKRNVLFSILEVLRVRLINFRLASIKKAFDEFETKIKNYTNMSVQNFDKVDLLLGVFEKAEVAHNELISLIDELLKFDFAEV